MPAPPRPKPQFPYLRYNENWEAVCAAGLPADNPDRLKCLGWRPRRHSYVSLAAEIRQVYETYQNQEWGAGPQDSNGWLLQRYLMSADWHITPQSRLFSEVQSSLENGRTGGPRSFDKDKLDVHQFFVDFAMKSGDSPLTLRVGRQEMNYGFGRLVNTRFGLNTRISFDGAKVMVPAGKKQLDLFVTRPTFQRQGFFNDVPDGSQAFWGAYFTMPLSAKANLDLYYLGLNRRQQTFNSFAGRFVPHTFGTRWSGNHRRMSVDDEANVQLGSFAGNPVHAWSISTQHAYTPDLLQGNVQFGVRAGISSGDNHADGRALGTFNPLFPRGKYFQQADLNGPSNSVTVLPAIDWRVQRHVKITPIYGSFWRYSSRDGLYNYAGQLLRKSTPGTTARHVGQLFEVDMTIDLSPRSSVISSYERFFTGAFLRQATPGEPVRYFTVWYDYHF